MGFSKLDRSYRRFQRTGDARALAAVFDLAAPELLRVGRHLCGDEAEAEDAVQATFETAIEKAASHDGRRSVMPWLLGVLAVHARKARERAGREPDPRRLADRLEERTVADPADLAADAELRALVERKVDELPETYAGTLRRYLTEGAAPQEIAEGLGISAGAVHVRIHRGLKLLRRALPAGAALGGGLTTARARGLEAVRAEVLRSSGAPTTLAAGGGGLAGLLSKPLLIAASAAVAAGVAMTVGPQLLPGDGAATGTDVAAARPSGTAGSAAAAIGPDDGVPPTTRRNPAAAGAIPFEATPAAPNAAARFGGLTADEWLARFEAVEGWRAIVPLGDAIAALPDAQAVELMRAIYHRLPTVDHRRQVLKSFVFHGGQPYALEIIDLAATDPSLAVQEWAWGYLEEYAFVDFSVDPSRYDDWRSQTRGQPVATVLRDSAASLVDRLRPLGADELERELDRLDLPDGRIGDVAGIDLAETLRVAGLQEVLARHLTSDDPALIDLALEWTAATEPDEAFLRSHVLALLDRPTEAERGDSRFEGVALTALGRSGQNWVVDELMARLLREPARWAGSDELFEALGDLGDPRVVRELVDLLERHDSPRTRYLLGSRALCELTGVKYAEGQDAAFWRGWLERNGARLDVAIDAFER